MDYKPRILSGMHIQVGKTWRTTVLFYGKSREFTAESSVVPYERCQFRLWNVMDTPHIWTRTEAAVIIPTS